MVLRIGSTPRFSILEQGLGHYCAYSDICSFWPSDSGAAASSRAVPPPLLENVGEDVGHDRPGNGDQDEIGAADDPFIPWVTGQDGKDRVGYGLAGDAGWQGPAADEIAPNAGRQRLIADQMTTDDQPAHLIAINTARRWRTVPARLGRSRLAVARMTLLASCPLLVRGPGWVRRRALALGRSSRERRPDQESTRIAIRRRNRLMSKTREYMACPSEK